MIALLLLPSPALAQPAVSAQDQALAETLFHEGKALMAAGRFADGCPKIAESQRLDPGGGTLLSLALCHEGEGRTASAWAEFGEAAAMAHRDGRADRETIARHHASALEPRLSRLAVRVPKAVAEIPGLTLRRDEVALGEAAWNVASPVDPGVHRVVAEAPGKEPWSGEVEVSEPGSTREIVVAALRDLPPPPEVPPPAPAPAPDRGRRVAAWVVGGTGAAALGAGVYLGIRALTNQKEADKRCPQTSCTDAEAVRLNHDARTSAYLSTAGFVVGVAGLGTAAALFLWPVTQPARATWRVTPMVGREGVGVEASGRF